MVCVYFLCLSVCYKIGCSGYTDVNILYPYATKMDAVVTWKLTFCVSVCYNNGSSCYTDVNIFAYPYATRLDAVVTRMLTFCVSVCYNNGSSSYTEVNILRIRMLQQSMQWLHGCYHFAYPYATKMEAADTRMLTFCVSVCYKKRKHKPTQYTRAVALFILEPNYQHHHVKRSVILTSPPGRLTRRKNKENTSTNTGDQKAQANTVHKSGSSFHP